MVERTPQWITTMSSHAESRTLSTHDSPASLSVSLSVLGHYLPPPARRADKQALKLLRRTNRRWLKFPLVDLCCRSDKWPALEPKPRRTTKYSPRQHQKFQLHLVWFVVYLLCNTLYDKLHDKCARNRKKCQSVVPLTVGLGLLVSSESLQLL